MLENTTIFLIINMISAIPYSLMFPLLPTLGKEDGLSDTILGWILSLFPLTMSIFSTIVPFFSKKYSRIKLLSIATFFVSVITMLYSILIYIPNKTLLIIIVFTLRIFHGISSAFISILLYSLTISLSEKGKTQRTLGRLEVAYSIGSSTGLLIDSVFFKIGGYPLPFLVAGLCAFIPFYLTFHIKDHNVQEDNDEEKNEDNYNYFKYILHPEIFSILIGFVLIMITITFYTPLLPNHLNKNYSISLSMVSLIYITPILPYIIIMHFLDKITAKFGNYITFIFDIIALGISSVLIYPVPPLPQSFIVIYMGILICANETVPAFIPGLVILAKNIKKREKSMDEMAANDIAAVLYSICMETGDFLGPVLGGYLSEKLGFKICCIIVSVIVLTYSAVFILFFYGKIKNEIKMLEQEKESKIKEHSKEEDINKHLKNN